MFYGWRMVGLVSAIRVLGGGLHNYGFTVFFLPVGNTWFIRWRARAMTVISSAVPIGGTLLTLLLAMAVQAWGWRWGAILAGILFLLIGIPRGLGVRTSPESMGLRPDGDLPVSLDPQSGNKTQRPAEERDATLRDAMKSWIFWLFVIGMTVRGGAYSTISVHYIPMMVWKGLTQEHAAFLLGAFAFLNWVAHFVIGWLADAMNRPKLLAICMLVAASSILLLIWGSGVWPLGFSRFFLPPLTHHFPIVWATIGDFFGRKSFATIRGAMAFFYTWGSVLGPVIAGAVYDHSQSYVSTLWGLCAILLLGALLTALMIKPWNNIRLSRIESPASA
jgi:MFS family permease